jgi:hypothetical protein
MGLRELTQPRSWGLRPRLYAATCFAGFGHNMLWRYLLRRFSAYAFVSPGARA